MRRVADDAGRGGAPMRILLAMLAVVSGLIVGCDDGAEPAEPVETSPEPTGTATSEAESGVVYIFARSPGAIVPGRVMGPDDIVVVDQLFDPLTRVDAGHEIVPGAAESWQMNGDATVHTFTLRSGATFHDGSPVTPEAFIRAWQRVADRTVAEPSGADHLLGLVEGIEDARTGGDLAGVAALDETTLEVTLHTPFADFPAVVSHPALAPLPPAADRTGDFERMPIGNGPFRMAEPWQPGQFIRLEPFADHPDAPEGLEQIVFRIYDQEDAVEVGYEDFTRGNLDLAPVPEGARAEALGLFGRAEDGRRGPGVLDGLRLTTVFFAFNVEVRPFDEPDVRRAIASLVDRDRVVAEDDRATRVAATSVVPDVLPGYEPAECAYCAFDPALARELLADVEGEIETIELVYFDGGDHGRAAESLRDAVDEVLGEGTLVLRPLEQAEWIEAIREGETGLFLSGWIGEYPRPSAFLDPLFHPRHIGTANLTRYATRDVTELLAAARAQTDPGERAATYREVEQIVLDEMPVVPLYFYRHAQVASERLAGVVVDATGRLDLTAVGG